MAERGQPLVTPARSDDPATSTSEATRRAHVPLWLIYLSPLLAILLIPLVAEIFYQMIGPPSVPAYPKPPPVARASPPTPSAQSASSSSVDSTERYFRAFTAKGSTLAVVLARGEY